MEKVMGSKGSLYALLPMLLLLLQTSTFVGAEVDIIFYESTTGCGGDGYACYGLDEDACCSVDSYDGGSVLSYASNAAGCLGTQFFTDGDCGTLTYTSSGNFCLYGGGFTGAGWFNECRRRRSLLGEPNSKKRRAACTKNVKPSAVVFTEDGKKGNWILHASDGADVTELYSQLKNVHGVEKVSWLQTQGATYKELKSDFKLESKFLG